jgi:hypothetical protein
MWLHKLIAQTDIKEREHPPSESKVPERKQVGKKTYRHIRVRCGSKKCKCTMGELHGPYWYAYWSEGGRTRSQYIGKKLPAKKES